MNFSKIKTMVGFAIKSNKIVFGTDNIEATRKPIFLIIADSSLSQRALTALEKIAQTKNVRMIIIPEKLEAIVYKTNCKAIAILDKNMSDNIFLNAGNGGGNLID